MGAGDVPTWVAAIAAWAGVVVNALIVFVALSPIRTAKRERAARGRLVAAFLSVPIGDACRYMHLACKDLNVLLSPDGPREGHEFGTLLANLENVREWVPPLLGRFNLSEAAYLNASMGEKLAQAVGATNAAIASLSSGLEAFAATRKFTTMDRVLAARKQVAEQLGFLLADFDSATRQLLVFAEYCEHLFPSANARSGDA